MVMGVPNQEVGDSDARTAWQARCITRMLEQPADRAPHAQHAAQSAARLWEACGQLLSPEDAANQWLGLQPAHEAVEGVLAQDRKVDHSPGRSNYPPAPRLEPRSELSR